MLMGTTHQYLRKMMKYQKTLNFIQQQGATNLSQILIYTFKGLQKLDLVRNKISLIKYAQSHLMIVEPRTNMESSHLQLQIIHCQRQHKQHQAANQKAIPVAVQCLVMTLSQPIKRLQLQVQSQ